MKLTRIPIAIGAIILVLLGLGYGLFKMKDQSEFAPTRPESVPANAVWAGGADGGSWALIKPSEVSEQYQVTLYDDSGRLWVMGEFWNSQHAVVNQSEIAQFNQGQLYLKNGSFLLPVGQQKRSFRDGTSITITYPDPSPEYTDASELTEQLLDSRGRDQATP